MFAATFLASDRAKSITATAVNASCGLIPGYCWATTPQICDSASIAGVVVFERGRAPPQARSSLECDARRGT